MAVDKKQIESDAAFFARRKNRTHIIAVKRGFSDPNNGFRLSIANQTLAARLKASADRIVAQRLADQAEAAKRKSAQFQRDQRIAQRSVELQHARMGIK